MFVRTPYMATNQWSFLLGINKQLSRLNSFMFGVKLPLCSWLLLLFLPFSLIGWGQIRRGVTITPTVDDD